MKSATLELLSTPERKAVQPGPDQPAIPTLAMNPQINYSLPA